MNSNLRSRSCISHVQVRLRGTAAATNFALSDYRADLAEYHKMQQVRFSMQLARQTIKQCEPCRALQDVACGRFQAASRSRPCSICHGVCGAVTRRPLGLACRRCSVQGTGAKHGDMHDVALRRCLRTASYTTTLHRSSPRLCTGDRRADQGLAGVLVLGFVAGRLAGWRCRPLGSDRGLLI